MRINLIIAPICCWILCVTWTLFLSNEKKKQKTKQANKYKIRPPWVCYKLWYSNNYSRRVHILISASSFKNKNSDQTTEDRENQWTHSHSHIHTNKQKSFKCATAARSAHFSISFEWVSVYEVKESCCWFLSFSFLILLKYGKFILLMNIFFYIVVVVVVFVL